MSAWCEHVLQYCLRVTLQNFRAIYVYHSHRVRVSFTHGTCIHRLNLNRVGRSCNASFIPCVMADMYTIDTHANLVERVFIAQKVEIC